MPLPEEYFSKKPTSITDNSLYPQFGEEEIDDKFSLYDMLGEAAWHFGSGATLGLTEFVIPTKPWEEKTTSERMGAAIGEAGGFFVPMHLIGKGVRGLKALTKTGSKGMANQVIKSATRDISDDAFKEAARKGLKKEVFSREGKRLLYQHELGGETLNVVNRTLMANTEASLRTGLKNANLKTDDAMIADIMNSLSKGLKEGKHVNSISHWLQGGVTKWIGSGKTRDWISKYTGEAFQDMVVLGLQGVLSNVIHSAAREDTELAPGSALGHAFLLSLAFPAIRSIGTGGERRIGELWNIVRADFKKTNYRKVASGENGPENIRGLFSIITGGRRKNLIGKNIWTAKSGKEYHVDDFLSGFKDLKDPKVLDDAVDILGQMQKSVGKMDMMKVFRKAYISDTINPSTILRMALGTAAMNLDIFKSPATLKDMPGEELLTHMLLGAMMSRGKGGWVRDPAARTGGAYAEEINSYYQLMNILGIKHTAVSEYLKVKDFQDYIVGSHIGLQRNPTSEAINEVYKKYEKIIDSENPVGKVKSKGGIDENIAEWKILRSALGIMESDAYRGFNPDYLTKEQRTAMSSELSRITYNDKPLDQVKYQEFMGDFRVEQAGSIGELYKNWLGKLGRESSEGANDKILNMFIDSNGRINHGGFNPESNSNSVHDLYSLLIQLEKRGMAQNVRDGGTDVRDKGMAKRVDDSSLERIDLANNSNSIERLNRLNKELKSTLNRMGLGDGVEMEFNIGNPESNPYLRTWLDSHIITSQKTLGDIAIGKLNPETQAKEIKFRDSVIAKISDERGNIVKPEYYRVVDSDGSRINDPVLEMQFEGIVTALYHGGRFTISEPIGKKEIKIQEKDAALVVDSYEALGLAVRPEDLLLRENTDYIKARTYEAINLRPQNIRIIDSLDEAALIDIDMVNNKIIMNTDEGIRDLARRGNLDPEQYVKLHNEIKESLPRHVIQPPPRGDVLDFPFESGKQPDLSRLRTIHKIMPEVYSKQIVGDVQEALSKIPRINENATLAELDLMDGNLINMKFDKALINLENLRKILPNSFPYEKIKDLIITKEREGTPLELRIHELSKDKNVFDAMRNILSDELKASADLESLLVELIYKGGSYQEGAIHEHNRIIDTLNAKLGSVVEKTSIDRLFDAYLQTNSFSSLRDLVKGLNQTYSGRGAVNELDNSHLLDSHNKMMRNYKSPNTITKISIAKKYDLLDRNNTIKASITELLRKRDFSAIKDKINPKLKTANLDDDLYYLSEIVRNTRDQKIVRLIIKKDLDGTDQYIREWVLPADNPEITTPSHLVIDSFNAGGVLIFPVARSGIIEGRFFNDISSNKNTKELFEHSSTVNRPESKHLKIIEEGGQLSPADEALSRLNIPTGPTGKLRYIEVSYGRPLALVENPKTMDALRTMFKDWYNETVSRYKADNSIDKATLENFKRAWDPAKVRDPEHMVRGMYNAKLNTAGFDKLWSPESINNLETGHFALNSKHLKYQKLAEGGNLKNLGNAKVLRGLLADLPDLSPEKRASIKNIVKDLENPNKQIRTGLYNDESPDNPFIVRTRHLDQLNQNISDPSLRNHLIDRYSNKEKFKNVMDVSSIDGAEYIDVDIRNLMLSSLGEGDFHVNGFKGSVARGGVKNTEYIMYDKGLFIYDPNVSIAMESKGIRFLKGVSTAKNIKGLSLSGQEISPRIATNMDFIKDINSLTSDNIIMHNLDGFNLRYGGHLSNNSPVPHPWTHYMPSDLVVGVRDGWQKLSQKMSEIGNFSNSIRLSANRELAEHMARYRTKNGMRDHMTVESFAESMLDFGFSTTNEVVREAIVKIWEENSLPIIIKPQNPKFAYPFIIPDLKSKHPVALDIYNSAGEIVSAARIQLGEGVSGRDADYMPVESIGELTFAFRHKDIDYTFNYNSEKNKIENIYTPLNEYQDKGYSARIEDVNGKIINFNSIPNPKVPAKIITLIENLNSVFKGKSAVNIHSVIGGEGVPSIAGVQRFIDSKTRSKSWEKLNFGLVHLVERGPRKGASDFIPVRIRKQDSQIGTAFKLNSLDTRANAQGDWDGDHVRHTHGFPNKDTKKFLRHAFKMSSLQEEYPTLPIEPRKANIYGLEKNVNGDLMHVGSSTSNNIYDLKVEMAGDSRAVGKIISMQSGLEWMYLTDFSIDGKRMRDRFDYDINTLVKNKDLFNRLEKGNQSVVDFISNLHSNMKKNGYGYMVYGDGEANLSRKMFDHASNDIRRDIVYEVIDILKAPSSIFNQIYTEGGPKGATSYDIQSRYSAIRRFFYNPNGVVLNNLIRKYRRQNIDLDAKLNELVPLFFKSDDAKVQISNMADFKGLLLSGKARPNKNVIKFKEANVEELIKASNIGRAMDEIVKSKMFKSTEIDNAWNNPNISSFKIKTDVMLGNIAMMRAIGVSDAEMINQGLAVFDVSMKSWLKNAEHASLVHNILSSEESYLKNKLDYQFGFKNGNQSVIRNTVDKLNDIASAKIVIETLRGNQVLETIQPTQKKYHKIWKADEKGRLLRHINRGYTDNVVYKVVGKLYKDGKPNFNALKLVEYVQPGKRSKKLLGEYLILENPIIGHRISKDSALDGYAFHFTYNTMPRNFVDVSTYNQYEADAANVAKIIKDTWNFSLDQFKNTPGLSYDIFGNSYVKRRLTLDTYFKRQIYVDANGLVVAPQSIIKGLSESESLIYYKAKMLLRPDIIPRQHVKGMTEIPYLKMNKRVFKDVFTYLKEAGHKEVASLIGYEYTAHKDFLSGRTNQSTYNLKPSSLFLKDYIIPEGMASQPLIDILSGVITPDMEVKLKHKGIGQVRYHTTVPEGTVDQKKITNMFKRWKEQNLHDKRRNCRQ